MPGLAPMLLRLPLFDSGALYSQSPTPDFILFGNSCLTHQYPLSRLAGRRGKPRFV